jgi:coiled-coil domain-containing protein 130
MKRGKGQAPKAPNRNRKKVLDKVAERKAQNKYFPPSWDPSKGSINTFRGSHHLRERAAKLKTEGILIIRFELPFDVFCFGCQRRVAMNTRYNAEKTQIGMFHSTPILSFKMRCLGGCGETFVIQTDPENSEFRCISGCERRLRGKRLLEEIGAAEEEGEGEGEGKDKPTGLEADPMYRLEHGLSDLRAAQAVKPYLEQLQDATAKHEFDYQLQGAKRAAFRAERRARDAEQREAEKNPLKVPLLALRPEDIKSAQAAFQPQPQTKPTAAMSAVERAKHNLAKRTSGAASIFSKRPKK